MKLVYWQRNYVLYVLSAAPPGSSLGSVYVYVAASNRFTI